MGRLDAEINISLTIHNMQSEYTIVQVNIPYLDKDIEIKVPNNIQEGHRIRLKGLGYSDGTECRGDLYVVVSKIVYPGESESVSMEGEKVSMQKMVVVEDNDFREVNNYLQSGWKVKEFKPFKYEIYLYVYVLLEN